MPNLRMIKVSTLILNHNISNHPINLKRSIHPSNPIVSLNRNIRLNPMGNHSHSIHPNLMDNRSQVTHSLTDSRSRVTHSHRWYYVVPSVWLWFPWAHQTA